MLEQLKSLVQEYAGDAIITNPAIPNEKNDEAVGLASHSILDGLKNAISNGGVEEVTNIFNGGEQQVAQAAVTQNIKGNFVEKLISKLGLDPAKASQIASSLIPMVMAKFVHKTNDPNDKSFDLSSILGGLTGGNMGDMLGKLTGGNNDKGEGGGLMDKVKGLFN
ncbi:MAG: DUF937 domain-containing protein [Chitinophagaceae bacterium]|nr:DUF937 domain-containing protein [Chitinophagaceae bacterium]